MIVVRKWWPVIFRVWGIVLLLLCWWLVESRCWVSHLLLDIDLTAHASVWQLAILTARSHQFASHWAQVLNSSSIYSITGVKRARNSVSLVGWCRLFMLSSASEIARHHLILTWPVIFVLAAVSCMSICVEIVVLMRITPSLTKSCSLPHEATESWVFCSEWPLVILLCRAVLRSVNVVYIDWYPLVFAHVLIVALVGRCFVTW